MQFLTIVVGSCRFDLSLDLSHTSGDRLFAAHAVYDSRILFVYGYFFGTAQHFDGGRFQFQTFLFRDDYTTGQHGDIFEHLFTTVAKTGSFYGTYFQRSTQAVYYQRCQSFAIDIFGDDKQRTTGLSRSFENRKHIFQYRYFLVVDQDVRCIHFALHLLGIGYEVRRDIAAVELHTFYDIDSRVGTFGFFDGDNTLFFHFLHSLGDELADFAVVVSRDTGNRFDFFEVVAYFLSLGFNAFDYFGHGFVDTAFQIHRICAGSYVFQTYVYNRLCQYGSCGRTVTGIVTCFGGYLFYQLGAHILERVFQFYLFGHRYTIFGDVGCTEFFLDNYITSFGTEGNFNGICQFVYPFFQLFTSLNIKFNLFCHSLYELNN